MEQSANEMSTGAIKNRVREYWSAVYGRLERRELDIRDIFVRLQEFRRVSELATIRQNMLVLDVGCGEGRWSLYYSERGCQVVAFDLSKDIVKVAKERLKRAGFKIDVIIADAEYLPFVSGSFSLVNCVEAMQYFPHPNFFLKETWRVLDSSGQLILHALNYFSPLALKRNFQVFFNIRKHPDVKWFSYVKLKRLLNKYSFQVIDFRCYIYTIPTFDSFYKKHRFWLRVHEKLEKLLDFFPVMYILPSSFLFKCKKQQIMNKNL